MSPQFIFECTVPTLSTLKRNLGEVFKDKSWEFIPDATVSTLSLLCQKIFCLATYKLFRLQRIGIYRLFMQDLLISSLISSVLLKKSMPVFKRGVFQIVPGFDLVLCKSSFFQPLIAIIRKL